MFDSSGFLEFPLIISSSSCSSFPLVEVFGEEGNLEEGELRLELEVSSLLLKE